MNSRPVASICRLRLGVSQNTTRRWLSAKPKKEYEPYENHGEKIYVIRHIERNHVIYSFEPTLSPHLIKRQIPFNGKKLYPSTVRKDYWDTMAVIEFPKGQGHIGRSVFQRLREFRKRHELEWSEPLFELSRRDRGVAINNQQANSVADMAAVLAGSGKGNLIATVERPTRLEIVKKTKAEAKARRDARAAAHEALVERNTQHKAAREAAGRSALSPEARVEAHRALMEKNAQAKAERKAKVAAETEQRLQKQAEEAQKVAEAPKALTPVTVFWQDLLHAAFAKEWSENVTHSPLPLALTGQTWRRKGSMAAPVEAIEPVPEAAAEVKTAEAA